MFDQPGIALDDLSWIRRDEFVHYLTLAHELGHPSDWPGFRRDLLAAVTAAFGFDDRPRQADCHRQDILDLLDSIRSDHDPAIDWPGFAQELWARRSQLGVDE